MLSIAGGVLLGLLVGSFLNVVIYRLPVMLEREWRRQSLELLATDGTEPEPDSEPLFNLVTPRSRCPSCGTQITAVQNIPVFSWLILGGKCASCQAPISARYPLIEALTGLLSGLIVWQFGIGFGCAAALLFLWALIALTVIDIDHQLLPDSITYPLLWLGLGVSLFFEPDSGLPFPEIHASVAGAMAGYLSLWSVYWLFKLATGKEGMGYGDFKLLAALGAWLGWQMLPLVILLSAVVGATVGVGMIVTLGRDRQIPIPFGPYLAGAGLIALLWGERITNAYLELTGL
ncbi:MAG: A24 family peptidase [Gammaproteobacteria bacterium]|jgi:leader peptidase (prepilin peptidase)/N-methyltransferase|nr:A24 family peptidase [Gammaproteobacteria bacterium]MDP6615568.1 A24 family peptidase [Gammaproteobacteria bacterium]MDP6694758.1 A24 family peptidase [Gammaproteobacteria bacterium]MDP7041426.1 A24 family peptidase [Gammaproteobacteria bacterium]